ncbi:MAG: PaaI family thioesterase [bacterium]|nr:PaaI family thioesterase [Gammaproteobacteria bacterium]HIL98209.1 PaaI family thioesterase [Pseudomonadales bacterium]
MSELPPHAKAMGVELVDLKDRKCIVRVPYAEHLVGDPDTGVIHGGVITATLDNASGWSVRCHEDWVEGQSMATLDIRIDYMKPAVPKVELIVEAECYKMTRTIAFVRGFAHQGDPQDPVATSVAAFMLGTPNISGKNL